MADKFLGDLSRNNGLLKLSDGCPTKVVREHNSDHHGIAVLVHNQIAGLVLLWYGQLGFDSRADPSATKSPDCPINAKPGSGDYSAYDLVRVKEK